MIEKLLSDIRSCTLCEPHLIEGVNPVVSAHPSCKIAIVGQAPGIKVHKSGIPWDDASGRQLRSWLDLSDEEFYDSKFVALVPMGFCYPGKGKTGDLPPRKECAPTWHEKVFDFMPQLQTIMLVGSYAQEYYLKEKTGTNLTETVKNYRSYLPKYLPVPHPSPRNRFWLKKNPWFETEVIPAIQDLVHALKK